MQWLDENLFIFLIEHPIKKMKCHLFAWQKVIVTCDAVLCVSHTRQGFLESYQEARIVQIEFSAACIVSIGGSVFSILSQFLSILSQHIMVDGSK